MAISYKQLAGTLAEINASLSDANLIDENDARIPTQDQGDALDGTSGSPSGTNPYVTDVDPRNTDARTPTTHALGGPEHSADTLANLNAKVSDATLIDTADSRLSDDRTASAIRTATTEVAVSGAAAPSSGQALVATSPTAAEWQTPSGDPPDPFTPTDGTWNVVGKISVKASGGAAGSEQYGDGASAGGTDSTAVGKDASAAGFEATALGKSASGSGNFSTALGKSASASQSFSTAVGRSALAAANRGTAVGDRAAALGANGTSVGADSDAGFDSVAVGRNAQAVLGGDSTAVGNSSFVGGAGGVALGDTARAELVDGVALGKLADVNEAGGIALGRTANVAVTHTNAVVIGKESQSTAAQRTTLGRVGGTAAQLQELQVSDGFAAFGATPPASQPAAIVDASGGATVDAEARTAINALLAVMRTNGLIAT